ncbi:MAG: thioredoxin family protein [Flavobacteriales bacterium]|nr:MAG: thioredoxin family protein [Flavobacteriales bacterium]
MKTKTFLFSGIFILLFSIFAFTLLEGEKYKTLEIGSAALKTDVKMKDISGKELSLNDAKKDNGLLVIFSCNTCPFVIQWEDRYPKLGEQCEKNNIGMVLINSNEAKRDKADSMDEMKKHAEEKSYNCSYVVDEKSAVANAFGAKTTPHVFLFDKDLKLVYEGAIDDNSKDVKEVKKPYLNNAISNLISGKKIDPNNTKSIGCSIKRVKS